MTDQGGGGDFGYGQSTPRESGDPFNVYSFIIDQALAQVVTMKPVIVKKVTGGGTAESPGTVDVLPLVNQLDGNGNSTPHGTVFGIPWIRLQGGKGAIVADPQVGDIGIVVCADRDISNVKSTKKQANPGSLRKFDLADGIYIGSILGAAPEQFVAFGDGTITLKNKAGHKVEMTETGVKVTAGSTVLETKSDGVHVTGNLVVSGNLLIGGNIQNNIGGTYAGDLKTSGDVIARFGGASVGLATHTHTQPNDSHGDAEQPTSVPTPGT